MVVKEGEGFFEGLGELLSLLGRKGDVSHAFDDHHFHFNAGFLHRLSKSLSLRERDERVLVAIDEEGGGIIRRDMEEG